MGGWSRRLVRGANVFPLPRSAVAAAPVSPSSRRTLRHSSSSTGRTSRASIWLCGAHTPVREGSRDPLVSCRGSSPGKRCRSGAFLSSQWVRGENSRLGRWFDLANTRSPFDFAQGRLSTLFGSRLTSLRMTILSELHLASLRKNDNL